MAEQVKLTEEDFEHIWLRHKSKMRNLTLGYLTLVLLIVSSAAWLWMDSVASKAVERFMNTEQFQQELLQQYSETLDVINTQISDAETEIGRIKLNAERMSKIPYEVTDYGFTLVSPDGNAVYVEYGKANPGGEVKFQSPFSEPPTITFSYGGSRDPKAPNAIIQEVTKEGALVSAPARFTYWIAIGK